jgi:hypothetical protein
MYHYRNIRHVNMHFPESDKDKQGFLFIVKSISILRWSTQRVVLVSLERFLNCSWLPELCFISYSNRCPDLAGITKQEFLLILGPHSKLS